MPKTSLRAEQTTTATVELDVALSARVSALLSTYHELKEQADLLYGAMDDEKEKIWALMKEAGHEKIEVDGTPCSVVRGYNSRLDKVKFVELGGNLKQLENATSKKPKKAYLLIGKAEEHEAA